VGVNVDLDGRVHADDTQTTNDLRRVADGLRAEQKLVVVRIPVVVKPVEALGAEADRGRSREVELARVEEVEESVLDHLGPYIEVLVVAVGKTTNDGIGNVADTGLQGQEVLGKAAVLDFVVKELDEMAGNDGRALVGGGVGKCLVPVVGLDDTDNPLGVKRDRSAANAVLDTHDEVGLAVRRQVCHGDVVQTLETREGCVDLDDDFVRNLHQLRGCTDRCTGDDTAILENVCRLDNDDIEVWVFSVFGVEAVDEICREHGQVLVKEVDLALVDALGNGLANLVRASPLNHVERSPSAFSLGAGRSATEEAVAHFALKVVLLNMVCEEGGDFLGIANTGEAGPAEVRAIGKVLEHVLWLAELGKHRRPPDAGLEQGRSHGRGHLDYWCATGPLAWGVCAFARESGLEHA